MPQDFTGPFDCQDCKACKSQAIIAKLLVTADGVPVVPGMKLWDRRGPTCGVVEGIYKGTCIVFVGETSMREWTPRYYYSTREAAEAAGGE